MNFETDYIKILAFAKKRVLESGLSVDPGDLVNDAYLKLFDKPYSIGAYRKEIYNGAIIEKHNKGINVSYGIKGSPKWMNITGEQCCRVCKEIKIVSEFYLIKDSRSGKPYIRGSCKSCDNKKAASWKKNNKAKASETRRKHRAKFESPQNERKRKEYMRGWQKNNKQKQRNYSRNYYARNSDLIALRKEIKSKQYLKDAHNILELKRTGPAVF